MTMVVDINVIILSQSLDYCVDDESHYRFVNLLFSARVFFLKNIGFPQIHVLHTPKLHFAWIMR